MLDKRLYLPERQTSKDEDGAQGRQRHGGASTRLRRSDLRRLAAAVNAVVERIEAQTRSQHISELSALSATLKYDDISSQVGIETFARLKCLCRDILSLDPYDVQLMGAWALLHGMLVELDTGEGKTLTAMLAASMAACAGLPVHVITANDYLAARDGALARPFLDELGFSVGTIQNGQTDADRREVYAGNIVYVSNKELVFDYLRDRTRLAGATNTIDMHARLLGPGGHRVAQPVMRGLHFAIADEADAIMIDEARVPLVLSRKSADDRLIEYAQWAMALAQPLVRDEHYLVRTEDRAIDLTPAGTEQVVSAEVPTGLFLDGVLQRSMAVRQALFAIHLLQANEHYLVRDGAIVLIDEYTGRLMADRSWSNGLHQMVEIKENCQPTPQNESIAQITYQRFFRRYGLLSGMTGTAREVRGEMSRIYGLPFVAIPARLKNRRAMRRPTLVMDKATKWASVAQRASQFCTVGRPVLIGTRTVSDTLYVSAALDLVGIDHVILSAEQDEFEARVVAEAGLPGKVTVATNMAGRGTDIQLHPDAESAGGLAVVSCEMHDARRIDRQLFGRAARQGNPGSGEAVLSLEDDLVVKSGSPALTSLLAVCLRFDGTLGARLGAVVFRFLQWRVERSHVRMRAKSVEADHTLAKTLAFAGRQE